MKNLEDLIIQTNQTIKETLSKIDQNSRGIIFVVDKKQILKGVVTDGDIRRALIKGFKLKDNISKAMNNFIQLSTWTKVNGLLIQLCL